MFYLNRPAFLDRTITLDELTNTAELWRLWFTSLSHGGGEWSPDLPAGEFIQLRAELYGFPVFERDTLGHAAMDAFAAVTCPASSVAGTPSDTLLLSGPWLDATSPASVHAGRILWQTLLDLPSSRGLCVSFIVRCRRGANNAKLENGFGGDILLFTLNRGNGDILLKTIWKPDRSGRLGGLHRVAPWAGEKAILAALNRFTRLTPSASAQPIILGSHWEKLAGPKTQDVSTATGVTYQEFRATVREPAFTHFSADKRVGNFISLFYDIPGTRGVATFALRIALSLMPAAVFFALALKTEYTRNRVLQVILGCFALAAAARIAFVKIKRARLYYKAMNAGLGKLYAGDTSAEVATFEGYEDDPHPRRFAAEWEALGAQHCFDFRMITASRFNAVSHLYALPADNANVALSYMNSVRAFKAFPSLPVFHLSTRFSDGFTLFTSNSSSGGYRKSGNPKVITRQVRGEFAPDIILHRHREVTKRLTAEGHKPLPAATTPAVVFDRMRQDHIEARKLVEGKTIYTWSDAIRQAFELPRKELFEPGWKRSGPEGP